ncbi:hypothetical protein HK104_008251 [Borealophlyctis nickersoniae]|nr:hypothetical protein HK104_008251 [Borealophlyctis nickersoniae]
MIRTGLQPQPWHYKHLLWVYLERMGEGGDKDQAWKTYGRLRRLGCAAADMRIYAMFLIWAVDRSSQKDVEWVYQTMRRSEIGFTAEGFDECAGIHAAVGDGPGVLTLYRMMTEAGVTPTEMAYGNVIRALTRCDDVESSEWVVSDMRSRGWSPPTNAIAALMSASLKSGESLEEWLELIRQHQLTPDVPVFIVVLMKAMRDRPYEEVAALIDKVLRDSPFEPNAVMFTVCIRYHMKHGHFDTAVQVFEDMEKCNVEPQAFNYGDMIEGCLINNRLEKVDGYLKAMSDRGLAPDKYMVANIIHAYIARGELKTALQTFYLLRNPILSTALSKILHSPTSSLPLTSASSSPSSSSSSSSSSPSPPPPPSPSTSLPHIPHLAQTSSSVSPSFRYHRPIRLNSYFVTLLMTTLGRESPSTALSMFFYLRSRGARVDAATYSQLLAYHVADIPNFNAIWRDMEAAGVRPRVEVYTPLIMSLLHSVDRGSVGRECMVILEEMASKGVLPNAVVYNAAIQTCAKADESVWCERLVARMQAEGFALDAHTYDWMVGVWTQYARDMVRAEVWAERRKFALGGYGARVRKRMAYGFALIRDEQAARAWLEKAEAEGEAPAKDVWYDEILNKLKTIEQLKNERDGVAEGPKAQGMRSSLVKPSDKLGRKESNREPPPPTPSVSSAGPRIGTPGGDDGSIKWWKETSLAEADIPPPLPNHATGRWSGLVAQVRASLSIPKGDDDDGGGGAEGNKGGNQVGR